MELASTDILMVQYIKDSSIWVTNTAKVNIKIVKEYFSKVYGNMEKDMEKVLSHTLKLNKKFIGNGRMTSQHHMNDFNELLL